MKINGMGLFHVSESEKLRTEVYYQPLTDSLNFQAIDADPTMAVQGAFLAFSLPFLMFKQLLKGFVFLPSSNVMEGAAEIADLQQMLFHSFSPHCEGPDAFNSMLETVLAEAKRARKKAGLPAVRDAAAEHYADMVEGPQGAYGPFGRREDARPAEHPLEAFFATLANAGARREAVRGERPRKGSGATFVRDVDVGEDDME